MLRYKIYQVITHPRFPTYAYYGSLLAFLTLFYGLWTLPDLSNRVFISENALSPVSQATHITASRLPMPVFRGDTESYLRELFSEMEIEAFPPGHPNTFSFIYRSPRAIGYECMALLFPVTKEDLSGVELAYGLYRYIQQEHSWLGKNLLFLFYDPKVPYSQPVRTWLSGYYLYTDPAPKYYGLIRLALVLDISAGIDYMTVLHGTRYLDGLNGQQVDIDLLSTSTKLLDKGTKFPTLVHPEPFQTHPKLKHLGYTLGSWAKIMNGNVDSPHSYFLQHGIVSLTWKSVQTRTSSPKFSFGSVKLDLLIVIEQFLRTVTGLDEQLHAGYYFYFLPKPDYFLPLSKYAYFLIIAILPLLFQSSLLLRYQQEDGQSLLLLLVSYLPSLLAIVAHHIWAGVCGSLSSFPAQVFLLAAALVLLFPIYPRNWRYFKGISNATIGLSVVSLGLYFFPLGLIAGVVLTPLKICSRPIPLHWLLRTGFVFGILALTASFYDLESLWETERCSGHRLWSAVMIGVYPGVIQLLQTVLISEVKE